MTEKEITLEHLKKTYKYYTRIFNSTDKTNLKIILLEKLEVLEKAMAIVKTQEG